MDCKKNYEKAIKKIEKDERCRPLCCLGPTGPKGEQGPTGPTGPSTITVGNTVTSDPGTKATVTNSGTNQNAILNFSIPEGNIGPMGPTGPTGPAGPNISRSAYIVTFSDSTAPDGIAVPSNDRLPIGRVELDLTNLVTIDESEETIQFNTAGYYRVSIIISAYCKKTDTDFDPDNDFISIGFRKIDTDNVYIGASEWSYDEIAKQVVAHGIITVENPKNLYELVNVSKQTIYLHNPDLKNIQSSSYFTNSILTIVIDYLGRQSS